MQIQNQFDLPLAPAAAWPILMNVPQTAACFPGASLIEQISDAHYKGRVTVKLGPLTMVFAGNLHIAQRDDAAHSATIKAAWAETKGRGNANTLTHFSLIEPAAQAGGTRVSMSSELQLAGQVAQYGRGVGMISALSAQLIEVFAQNLRASLAAGTGGTPQPGAAAAAEISGLTLMAKALGSRLKG